MSTYAFVGNGSISQANCFALLNDLFGIKREYPEGHEKEGYPEWPSDERPNMIYVFTEGLRDGFETAWLYTEYAELQYTAIADSQIKDAEGIEDALTYSAKRLVVNDVPAVLLRESIEYDPDTTLIVLTNKGELDVHAKDVVTACQERGIRVLELTAALTEYKAQGLTPAPADTPAPEPKVANEESENNDEGQQFTAPDHLRVESTTQGSTNDGGIKEVPFQTNISDLFEQLYPMIRRALIRDGFKMEPRIGEPRG